MAIQRDDWGPGGENRLPVPAQDAAPANGAVATTGFDGAAFIQELEARHSGQPMPAGHGLDPQMLNTWAREGGVERNLAEARANATKIFDGVGDPRGLQDYFDTELPADIQAKVFDVLRLSPGRGGAVGLLHVLDRNCSRQQWETFSNWFDNRSDAEEAAVLSAFERGR